MRLPGIAYDSPNTFSPAQRIQLAVIPPMAAGLIFGLFGSCRWRVLGQERLDALLAQDGRCIISIWHESMAMACWHYRGHNYHTLTSYSFDGELAARIIRLFNFEAVRGSSSRGGSDALKNLTYAASMVPAVGFTLDGPRGPRRVAKPGIAILSARSGLRIIPHALIPRHAYRFHSWDRFPLPCPFTEIISVYGEPIEAPKSEHPDDIEATRLAVEESLNGLYVPWEAESKTSL